MSAEWARFFALRQRVFDAIKKAAGENEDHLTDGSRSPGSFPAAFPMRKMSCGESR